MTTTSRHSARIARQADAAKLAEYKADATLAALAAMTPNQAATWVENNVTTLAQAKTVLKLYAKILVILARQIK